MISWGQIYKSIKRRKK